MKSLREMYINLLNELRYKWKPSGTQKREFAKRMEDPKEKEAYLSRKANKIANNKASSVFDYETAGGSYIPTKIQHDFCLNNSQLFATASEKEAMNMVMSGFVTKEKVHHDFIHIVNNKIRNNIS